MSHAELTMPGHSAQEMAEPTFSIPAKKMAMWLFIIADSATFAGCLVAYGFIRNATPDWPRPFHGITNVALMTLILLTSSLTMMFAVRHAQLGDKAKAFRWTLITAVCGIMFAALHLREWFGMIGEGATLFHNPWGTPLFSSLFFSITGLHLPFEYLQGRIAVRIGHVTVTLVLRVEIAGVKPSHGPHLAFPPMGGGDQS